VSRKDCRELIAVTAEKKLKITTVRGIARTVSAVGDYMGSRCRNTQRLGSKNSWPLLHDPPRFTMA
jgi:hypothetical protein